MKETIAGQGAKFAELSDMNSQLYCSSCCQVTDAMLNRHSQSFDITSMHNKSRFYCITHGIILCIPDQTFKKSYSGAGYIATVRLSLDLIILS